jgi:dihydroorotate dehydrogenase
VRRATRLPLAVKLSPYFSPLTNMAGQLVEAGPTGRYATGWTATASRPSTSSRAASASGRSPSPGAFERANYIKTLASHSAPGRRLP